MWGSYKGGGGESYVPFWGAERAGEGVRRLGRAGVCYCVGMCRVWGYVCCLIGRCVRAWGNRCKLVRLDLVWTGRGCQVTEGGILLVWAL